MWLSYFANLPGPKKLEKATEFTLGLFSGYAFLGPLGLTGVSAAEVSALSEASQTMYSALKTECINAIQLAAKTGLPPESFAGLANVIREFPETLATGLQFSTGEAQKLFKFALNDQELVTSNYLGKSIAERIKTFAQRFTEKRNIIQTGAEDISVREFFVGEKWATQRYEEIRKCTTDVKEIAQKQICQNSKLTELNSMFSLMNISWMKVYRDFIQVNQWLRPGNVLEMEHSPQMM